MRVTAKLAARTRVTAPAKGIGFNANTKARTHTHTHTHTPTLSHKHTHTHTHTHSFNIFQVLLGNPRMSYVPHQGEASELLCASNLRGRNKLRVPLGF